MGSLDGVWATAPYFHNGSVPTLEGVLNPQKRPIRWQRDFESSQYNLDQLGWPYIELSDTQLQELNPEIQIEVYDTTQRGYGNHGHLYGAHLSEEECLNLIEYLKTL